MKALTILLLASLPVPNLSAPQQTYPQPHFVQQAQRPAHKGGTWYFARTGHAVYCYGPVMTMTDVKGDVQRVATFCRGDKLLVPLKD